MAKKKMTLEEKLEEAVVKDVPYESPGNWIWSSIRSLAFVTKLAGFEYSKNIAPNLCDSGIPLFKGKNVKDGRLIFEFESFIPKEVSDELPRSKVNKKCLLTPYVGSIGNVALFDESGEYHLGSNVGKIEIVNKCISEEFLLYYLRSFIGYKELTKAKKATAQESISIDAIRNVFVPIPPLKEQQRIVDKIESLFEKLDKAKELIEEARDDFEKRKSAILDRAFRGELTKEWRKTNVILENKIIARINEFYSDKLSKKDYKILGELQSKVTNDKSIENSNWIKCTIGAIAKVSNGSTPSRKNEDFWNGTIPWVSSGEVKNNRINHTKECITEEGFNNSSVKLLKKGSVLMAMIGEGKTRGQSSILDIDATTNQNIAAIDLSHGEVESEFLWYWLQYNYKRNRDGGNGTGPKALNCQKVRELEFIVPPKREQEEIVRILDKLLEEESKIEELTKLDEQIELIKKSILAKAFRGQLGTNCEEDESALELLKDILKEQ